MFVPKLVQNGYFLLGICEQFWASHLLLFSSQYLPFLNLQECVKADLKPFLTNLGTRMRAIGNKISANTRSLSRNNKL
jgi:hypothetical protein